MSMIEDPSADDVFYPECDDEPMAESWYQAQAIRTLQLGFERVFAGRVDVAIGADNFWYPVRGEPKIVVAPDTMVIVGLPKPFDYVHAGSYQVGVQRIGSGLDLWETVRANGAQNDGERRQRVGPNDALFVVVLLDSGSRQAGLPGWVVHPAAPP